MSDPKNYYEKISLRNKTPEEAERITKLFNDNINIANKVASKYYKTKYWDFDEALQIAKMGLWKACLIWDPDKYRISTLAYNIINRDFMDYDNKQKRQPPILFNLEDTCVTDDLTLDDVLADEGEDIYQSYEDEENLKELNDDIIYILEDISEDLKISKSIVKTIYLVYIESNKDNIMNLKTIDFIPRSIMKNVIKELQKRLLEIM